MLWSPPVNLMAAASTVPQRRGCQGRAVHRLALSESASSSFANKQCQISSFIWLSLGPALPLDMESGSKSLVSDTAAPATEPTIKMFHLLLVVHTFGKKRLHLILENDRTAPLP